MRKLRGLMGACAAAGAVVVCSSVARAHGIIGNRFFPATVTTDDPFAVDELALPTVSVFATPAGPDSPSGREVDAGFEFDKEIFPRFAIGVSDTYTATRTPGEAGTYGWTNLELTAKYELILSELHEAIVSVGLKADVGGTGSKAVADSFSTFTPVLYFGKGFGDLPDSLDALKPLAVTGSIGQTFPTSAEAANTLQWGFAVEYSLPYLREHVKDVGLPEPLRNMIPLVEFSMETTENRVGNGLTTGTINPGVLWETPYFQLGVEALVPVNGRTGPHVGAVVQVWIYIDDLFPRVFGHPVFGGQP